MTTIPSSLFATVTPSVIGAGGTQQNTIGLFLTNNTRVPANTVLSFPNYASVAAYFGATAQEAILAAIYFAGFTNSDVLPAALLFAQYNQAAVAAYLRGGTTGTMTLAQLQALSGTLTVVIDGYPRTGGSISLAGATSFTSAASIIQSALNAGDPVQATFTASIGSTFTGSMTTTVLTVSAVAQGILSIGDTITGAGVAANTKIVSLGTGTGGTGTYNINNSQSVASETMTGASNVLNVTAVSSGTITAGQSVTGTGVTEVVILSQLTGTTGGIGTYSLAGTPQTVASESMTSVGTPVVVSYDPVATAFVITSGVTGAGSTAAFASGTLAPLIFLTSATGAILSQGQAAQTPASIMNQVTVNTQAFATFMTTFDPDGGSGNALKQAFAAWKNGFPNQFCYVAWDNDASPTASVPATASLGQILAGNGDSGTCPIYDSTQGQLGAFVCGAAAAIAFNKPRGRITFAFKGAAGITPSVTTAVVATNLAGLPQVPGSLGNGYNYYGAVAAAGPQYQWFQRGTVTGAFKWLDSYINQIWLNSQFQQALTNLQNNAKTIPYSTTGTQLIDSALSTPIQAGLTFGAFGPATLSAAQITNVNATAGTAIAATLQAQGYYLQILPAPPATREARTSPPCTFWYIDQGSVQAIQLSSIALE